MNEFEPTSDDLLDRAIHAVKSEQAPPGPSAEAHAETLAVLRRAAGKQVSTRNGIFWRIATMPTLHKTAAAIIVLDQISKQWVLESFFLYERRAVTGFLNLTHVYNPGAAFSFLADAGDSPQAPRATLLMALADEELAAHNVPAARAGAVAAFKELLAKWPASREASQAYAGISRLTASMSPAE